MSNYALQQEDPEETRELETVKQLRQLELAESKVCTALSRAEVVLTIKGLLHHSCMNMYVFVCIGRHRLMHRLFGYVSYCCVKQCGVCSTGPSDVAPPTYLPMHVWFLSAYHRHAQNLSSPVTRQR